VYYGKIDKTKIDEIYLDIYRLYGTTDVSAMEEKAIDESGPHCQDHFLPAIS
jgi:hypothetical protein